MKYTLTVVERYNLGNYEYAEASASVEFTDEDANGYPEVFGREQLDALLRSHRRRYERLVAEGVESFLLEHPALES